jgi:hypothetical protein
MRRIFTMKSFYFFYIALSFLFYSCSKQLEYEYNSFFDPFTKEALFLAVASSSTGLPSCDSSIGLSIEDASNLTTEQEVKNLLSRSLSTGSIQNRSAKVKTAYYSFTTKPDYYYSIFWQDKNEGVNQANFSANVKITAYSQAANGFTEMPDFKDIEDGSKAKILQGDGNKVCFRVDPVDGAYGSFGVMAVERKASELSVNATEKKTLVPINSPETQVYTVKLSKNRPVLFKWTSATGMGVSTTLLDNWNGTTIVENSTNNTGLEVVRDADATLYIQIKLVNSACTENCLSTFWIETVPNVFLATGSMTDKRAYHTADLLNDGKVIVVMGIDQTNFVNQNLYRKSIEVFDPSTSTFAKLSDLSIGVTGHSAVVFTSGDLLITGGEDNESFYSDAYLVTNYSAAKSYDLKSPRTQHTTTLMGNGEVVVIGGRSIVDNNGNFEEAISNSGELYINKIAITNTMNVPRYLHTSTLLDDGRILVVGGLSAANQATDTSDFYNVSNNSFSAGSKISVSRYAHTATKLSNGKVLIAGGRNTASLSGAELFDPTTNTFTITGSLNTARAYATATLLNNGKVLIAGGLDTTTLQTAEVYDPATGTFTLTRNMTVSRNSHTATKLKDGTVIIIGGRDGNTYHSSAEVFYP